MDTFDVLSLLCGLALFLFGMNLMGDALKKSAGGRLKTILGRMTSNNFKGFMLGLGVTAIIQSSSATTVMVVGFVNSGAMTLTQSIGVIMGANVGTAVTSWLTGLSGLGGTGEAVSAAIVWLKPTSWTPILAVAGTCLYMFSKSSRRKDTGLILLGFTVLMLGMETMSGAVAGLKSDAQFQQFLTMFENPLLGVLAGTILTAIVQSSSASVGILQSLTTTGAITYGAAIPIVMGQNIGTCVTAMLSSIGATKNGRRAALAHLYFNIIAVAVWLGVFYAVDAFVGFAFVNEVIDMWGVAIVHTVFKFLAVLLIAPFTKQLERLATLSVRGSDNEREINELDERLFSTPSVAVERAEDVTREMAHISCDALRLALTLLPKYDKGVAAQVRDLEAKADVYEDELGTYLVKLASHSMTEQDSHEITKLLHLIGDFERISDHAVDLVESAEELRDKEIEFSGDAEAELSVISDALREILTLAEKAFCEGDMDTAAKVEPLEQVIDYLKDQIKLHHVLRLQNNECSIEHGFVLSDILTNIERASDHCSNIAGCVIEITRYNALGVHEYLNAVKTGGHEFDEMYSQYRHQYSLTAKPE